MRRKINVVQKEQLGEAFMRCMDGWLAPYEEKAEKADCPDVSEQWEAFCKKAGIGEDDAYAVDKDDLAAALEETARKRKKKVRLIVKVASGVAAAALVGGVIAVRAISRPVKNIVWRVEEDEKNKMWDFYFNVNAKGEVVRSEDIPVEIETKYEPTYLPEGFEKVREFEGKCIRILWYKKGGKYLLFRQYVLSAVFSSDQKICLKGKQIDINGYNGHMESKKGRYKVILWTTEDYQFRVEFDTEYKKELLQVAESVSEKK